MPENEKQDMQVQEADPPPAEAEPETSLERLERERLSRRAALRRMGVTSALSVFALFSVDDLARMVGAAMERRAGDSRVAERVAREFRQAGIAMAAGPSATVDCTGCTDAASCVPDDEYDCVDCDASCDNTLASGTHRRKRVSRASNCLPGGFCCQELAIIAKNHLPNPSGAFIACLQNSHCYDKSGLLAVPRC